MDKQLLEILTCPICHQELVYHEDTQELVCKIDQLSYPIEDGIPILLTTQARDLNSSREK